MAGNVFGHPITDQTLREMPEYKMNLPSRKDRMNAAMEMKNYKGKEMSARQYVEKLKKEYGNEGVCTLCLVYNATGDSLTIATAHDFMGHIGKAPYPIVIQNGQWGAFLHVAEDSEGSKAFVVYHGENSSGLTTDYMLAWCTTSKLNQVYPDIGKHRHFLVSVNPNVFKTVSDSLAKSGAVGSQSSGGLLSIASTATGTSPLVEAMFTLT